MKQTKPATARNALQGRLINFGRKANFAYRDEHRKGRITTDLYRWTGAGSRDELTNQHFPGHASIGVMLP